MWSWVVLYSAGSVVSSVYVVLSVLRSFRDVYVSVWCCDSYVVRVCGSESGGSGMSEV